MNIVGDIRPYPLPDRSAALGESSHSLPRAMAAI
jgi:hypothetical protein